MLIQNSPGLGIEALQQYRTNSLISATPAVKPSQPATVDQVSISSAAQQKLTDEEKWQAIANKYDVTNISDAEHQAMAKELYDSGLISFEEAFNMAAPFNGPKELGGYDPDKKWNFIELTQVQAELEKRMEGRVNPITAQIMEHLDKLQNYRNA